MANSTKKTNVSTKKLYVRIICIILAFLMAGSTLLAVIFALFGK